MTYKQAYDKIIDAYFKETIQPMDCNFCFCGTLCGDDSWGSFYFNRAKHNYSRSEYLKLEAALLKPLIPIGVKRYGYGRCNWGSRDTFSFKNPLYEDLLFQGISNALEVLKQIHIDRGENVDEVPVFNKRQLA